MTRQDVVLAMLGSATGRAFSPVQLQKAMFLVQRNIPEIFGENQQFAFEPYDYGPFDRSVYDEATALASLGLAKIEQPPGYGIRQYSASEEGEKLSRQILANLNPAHAEYVDRVSTWVRSLGFAKLVKSIYEAYPDTRANSIFVG